MNGLTCVIAYLCGSAILLWRLKSGTLRVLMGACLVCLLVMGLVGRASLNKKRPGAATQRTSSPPTKTTSPEVGSIRIVSWKLEPQRRLR